MQPLAGPDSSYWEFTGRGNESESTNTWSELDANTYRNGDIAVEFIFNLAKKGLY